jgi:hypothetical protein
MMGSRQQQEQQDRRAEHRVDDHRVLPAPGVDPAGQRRGDHAADPLGGEQQPDQGRAAVQPLEDEQGDDDRVHAPHDVQDAERQSQATQGPVAQGVRQAVSRRLEQAAARGRSDIWLGQPDHDHGRGDEDRADEGQRLGRSPDLHDHPRQRRPDHRRQDVADRVGRVGPFPERLGHQQREQAAQARRAQRRGQRRDRRNRQQQPDRQPADRGKEGDQAQRGGCQQVVDQDETDPPVAIEQGPGDRREDDSGQGQSDPHQPGQRRGVVDRQGEQDHRHVDHRLGNPGDLHADQEACDRRDAEERPVRTFSFHDRHAPTIAAADRQ